MTPVFEALAVAAPGFEDLVADELQEIGLNPGDRSVAGVSFRADHRGLYRANLHLRIASRVIVRVAQFEAAHFSTLEKQVRAVDWSRWLTPGTTLASRVTCRKSRLYHSGAVGERVQGAIASQLSLTMARARDDEEDEGTGQLLIVRLDHDQCTMSIDASGALLHRRGYRQAVAKAPMRETIAAALLRASRWHGDRPLVDPMCGSGTIPIEAAMIARRMAPGRNRTFAFERWPAFQRGTWDSERDRARSEEKAASPVSIQGSDRDAGAIVASRQNAERAGVSSDITFESKPLSAARAPSESARSGLLLTNPPYGERVGESGPLRNLYAQVGNLVRGPFAGWGLGMLTADAKLARQTGLPMSSRLAFSNGGLRVTYLEFLSRGSEWNEGQSATGV